jgi:hypothetical protein
MTGGRHLGRRNPCTEAIMQPSITFALRVALAVIVIALAVVVSGHSRPAPQTLAGAAREGSPARSAAGPEANFAEPAWMMWLPVTADLQ